MCEWVCFTFRVVWLRRGVTTKGRKGRTVRCFIQVQVSPEFDEHSTRANGEAEHDQEISQLLNAN